MAISSRFRQFSAVFGNFRQSSAIFGRFRQFVTFWGKFWNLTKKNWSQYLNPVQSYAHFRRFLAVSGNFRQFPAVFGNFRQLLMFCGKFWDPTKKIEVNISIQYKVMAQYGSHINVALSRPSWISRLRKVYQFLSLLHWTFPYSSIQGLVSNRDRKKRDGRTDGQTDGQGENIICLQPVRRRHN